MNGIERAVLVVRRAEIAQPGMRLALDVLRKAPPSAATCRCPARRRSAPPVLRRFSPAASAAAAARFPRRARRAASPPSARPRSGSPRRFRPTPARRVAARQSRQVVAARDPRDRTARRSAGGSLSAITSVFGVASACSRAARFGVSPTTPRSCAAPSPIRSPTTTSPVAMPSRTRRCFARRQAGRPRRSPRARRAPPARHRPHAPADSRNRSARRRPCTWRQSRRSGRPSRRRAVISADHLAQILGIVAASRARSSRRDRRTSPLAAGVRRWTRPPVCRSGFAQGGNRGEQLATMADAADTQVLQVVSRQLRQYRSINGVVAKRLLVLLKPETA